MRFVSYNIQYGFGRDGIYDLPRAIAAVAGSGAAAAFVGSSSGDASGGSGDGTHEAIVSIASAAAVRTGTERGIGGGGEFASRLAMPRPAVTAP